MCKMSVHEQMVVVALVAALAITVQAVDLQVPPVNHNNLGNFTGKSRTALYVFVSLAGQSDLDLDVMSATVPLQRPCISPMIRYQTC